MKILVTGSAGRIGRHIYIHLMRHHQVVGLDMVPCSTADFVGDLRDRDFVRSALQGVDVIVHAASLHAPHVGLRSDQEFAEINIEATEQLVTMGIELGISHFIYTSTTALYGYASTPNGRTSWITETVTPQPRTVYHRTKIQAENLLQRISRETSLPVTVLQMSRCFPEPADMMAVYRLTRGIDARDVASAHGCAINTRPEGFNRYILSAKSPFRRQDCSSLYQQADAVISQYEPELAAAFQRRGWTLPKTLDRVYDSSMAQQVLGWQPRYGYNSVLAQLDNDVAEVLPVSIVDNKFKLLF